MPGQPESAVTPDTAHTEGLIKEAQADEKQAAALFDGHQPDAAELEAAKATIDHLYAEAPFVVKEAKAGYKTTEFWLSLVGVVLAQVGALDLPGHSGKTIATVAILASYALSRGVAKAGVGTSE